jgi:hypothetical protein
VAPHGTVWSQRWYRRETQTARWRSRDEALLGQFGAPLRVERLLCLSCSASGGLVTGRTLECGLLGMKLHAAVLSRLAWRTSTASGRRS